MCLFWLQAIQINLSVSQISQASRFSPVFEMGTAHFEQRFDERRGVTGGGRGACGGLGVCGFPPLWLRQIHKGKEVESLLDQIKWHMHLQREIGKLESAVYLEHSEHLKFSNVIFKAASHSWATNAFERASTEGA